MGKRKASRRLGGGEAGVLKRLQEGSRCLVGYWGFTRMHGSLGSERVVPIVQHLLGQAHSMGSGLDAQIPEHGVRFPAAEQHDDVFVDASTEQGRWRHQDEGSWC